MTKGRAIAITPPNTDILTDKLINGGPHGQNYSDGEVLCVRIDVERRK